MPSFAQAHGNRGQALRQLGPGRTAERLSARALTPAPHAPGLSQPGRGCRDLNRLERPRPATGLWRPSPDHAERAHARRHPGCDLERPQQALVSFDGRSPEAESLRAWCRPKGSLLRKHRRAADASPARTSRVAPAAGRLSRPFAAGSARPLRDLSRIEDALTADGGPHVGSCLRRTTCDGIAFTISAATSMRPSKAMTRRWRATRTTPRPSATEECCSTRCGASRTRWEATRGPSNDARISPTHSTSSGALPVGDGRSGRGLGAARMARATR